MCGTKNPLGERFCMACGQPIAQVAPPAAGTHPPPAPVLAPNASNAATPAAVRAAQTPAPSQVPAHAPVLAAQAAPPVPQAIMHASSPVMVAQAPAAPAPAPLAGPPVFAQPVIDIGGAAAEPPGLRVCGRCRGANQGLSLFCRYCGASLANAQLSPAPPGVAPAPAPGPAAALALTPIGPAVAPLAPPVAPAAPPPLAAPLTPANGAQAAQAAPARIVPAVTAVDEPFELPKASSELIGSDEPRVSPKDPATERDSRKGTLINAKARPSRGQLVVITKEGTPGPSYPIFDQVDIGRTEGDVILAEDRYLSPRHARLSFRDDRLFLRDLDSVNGLFLRISALRGKKVGEIERAPMASGAPASAVANVDTNVAMELQDQDLILIGQQVLRFEALKDGEAGLGAASEHGTLLFGTPTAPRYARLSQRTVEGVTRDVYYIRKVETVLGRESGDVVFTDDPFLSRRHAAFLVSPFAGTGAAEVSSRDVRTGPSAQQPNEKARLSPPAKKRTALHLVDLGSSNDTFLGLRGETEVRTGDLVRMGQQLFRIDIGGGHG